MDKRLLFLVLALTWFFDPQAPAATESGGDQLDSNPVRFAVIGDRTGGHAPGLYSQALTEIARLKPEFVITVGDMIEGYTEDTTVLTAEWNEYLGFLEPLTVPIYHTPGNHDITTDAMLDHYLRRIGQPYYSFDHRGLHIIVLDNSRWELSAELPKEQLDWLIEDLNRHRDAAYILVFYHRPFWYNTTATGRPDTLHSLFVTYGVDAVFTGHFHRYFSGRYDGITYTCCGSSGAHLEPGPAGEIYHFLWVTIDNREIAVAPIKMSSVLDWSFTTADDLRLFNTIRRRSITVEGCLAVSAGLTVAGDSITVRVRNPHEELALEDTLRWSVPEGWTVDPQIRPVSIPPGEESLISFEVRCDRNLFPLPSIAVGFPFKGDESVAVSRVLRVARSVIARRAAIPPEIDGKLSEAIWTNPAWRFFDNGGGPAEIDSTRVYFACDDDNVYLAARCGESRMDSLSASVVERDGAVYGDDCVGFFFQPDTATDTVYQLYINPQGVVFDQKISWQSDGGYNADRSWNGEYEIRAAIRDDNWVIEGRLPLAQFGAEGDRGQDWGVNFRRKQKRLNSAGDWQTPIDYHPDTFGILRLAE